MISSILKKSKSLTIKIVVGIIILPFLFWGMGDVFRGGNQNILINIDNEKVSTQEFMNYLRSLNLSKEDIESLKQGNLLDKIVSEYIGKKVGSFEIKKIGIEVTDQSLKDIITQDELFIKEKKFSRIEYEKFLLTSGVSATQFERNLREQEKKRQLLSYLSQGIVIPFALVNEEFSRVNQTKNIKYIDLTNLFNSKNFSLADKEKIFNENKEFFVRERKDINIVKLAPSILTGAEKIDKKFFEILDLIENKILDGASLVELTKEFNLNIFTFKDLTKKTISNSNKEVPREVIDKVLSRTKINEPEIVNYNNKYFLADISKIDVINLNKDDEEVRDFINSRLALEFKIKKSSEIFDRIKETNSSKNTLNDISKENNLSIVSAKISSINDNKIFAKDINKKIFNMVDGDLSLVSDNLLKNSYLIKVENSKKKKINKSSSEFKKYENIARLRIANEIFSIYDENLNNKYNVEVNGKGITKVKNSF